jgi:hypothetical protein
LKLILDFGILEFWIFGILEFLDFGFGVSILFWILDLGFWILDFYLSPSFPKYPKRLLAMLPTQQTDLPNQQDRKIRKVLLGI